MNHKPLRLRYRIIAFSLVRTIIACGHRIIYPFRTVIARGLGVDLSTIDQAIAARSALGIFGPLLGAIGDARGRRFAMLLGLLLFAGAMALVAFWPTFPALFAALLIAGAAKIIFDSAAQAYLGDAVPYRQRGLAIGVYEMSWSWAFLLMFPIGSLMAASGWSAPFVWIAGLAAIALFVVWQIVPARKPKLDETRPSVLRGARTILTSRPALAALAVSGLISMSNEMVGIIFGQWLEEAFALQITALGATAIVIGVAELGGEGLVASLSDRLGKRRAVTLGLAASLLCSVLLPLLGSNATGAQIGLFLFFISFEFTLVTMLSLMTELVPGARATLLAGNLASQSIGRALGALSGSAIFAAGIAANGLASAGLYLAALALFTLFVRENHEGVTP